VIQEIGAVRRGSQAVENGRGHLIGSGVKKKGRLLITGKCDWS